MKYRYFLRWPNAFLFLLTGLSILSTSCSNTKDTWVNRRFHNLSAQYNGYYNANLKVQEGVDRLAASHEDKYDRILSVFKYANAEKAKAIYPQMDDAMKRLSTVIQRHTILDKRGNEKPDSEKWIDDNWLLYGKALFFKREYFEAIEAFKYVEATYKKEPTRHVASLWIAKTYLQLTLLREAENKLDYVRNQKDYPKKQKWEYDAVRADYHLQTKNYEKAIEHLTRAAVTAPKRADRVRFSFILAQLNQQEAEYQKAFRLYTKVIKSNPPYEMAFNARINRARCFDANSKEGETVRKELLKMEKDPKNKEFLDQIYYALAGLARMESKFDEEVNLLNKSLRASAGNQNQKALSYLALAKINFDKPDYMVAQQYYDSTIVNLANDHPDYTDILTRRNSLTRLVKFLKTIQVEDSLQQLSRLSKAELDTLISQKIRSDEEAAAALKKAQEQEGSQVNQIFDPSKISQANTFNQGSGANWYFYNPQAVSFGFNEFTKKWGNRKLEDNWRRSSKETVLQDLVDDDDPQDTSQLSEKDIKDPKLLAEKKKENMLKNIPSTPEDLEKSTAKIIDAYYNAAMIYREQIKDLNASVEMFETLLKKYPGNKYELQSYYQLYRVYRDMNETAKSDVYKNLILSKYGDTEYAEIIRNPEYAATLAGKKSNLDLFYEDTYRKYMNGEYQAVIQRKTQADIQFPQNILTPKFDMLRALSIGKTQPLAMFEVSLQDIVRNHSADPVKDEAQNILDYIKSMKPAGSDTTGASAAVPPARDTAANKRLFNYMPDTMHYVIIIFQAVGGEVDGILLKRKISDFNGKNYSAKSYSTSDLMFDHRQKIITVKSFRNKADALSYSSHLYNNDDVYGNTNPNAYRQFVISINNYPELLLQKKLEDYDDFYRSFYR
ncbi:MAG: hypothetical protein DWQ44_04215 [Bacteroidetes bacterium]|nr:MAG: hypothetical protein DWQ33_11575 [Bacteroidota bacterium]REK00723.1 MAG: hypothetical protein DWQ39_11250 [Bacteroidota bacterium]REK35155.1 MAG: hypothetical protein DWQ44_04215 [Bacteroidota bacterium]REK48232.1 MAG: hypothetical protein DWQ48_10415 [Bacteroidota bacterium]